jgi:hypothetical protein
LVISGWWTGLAAGAAGSTLIIIFLTLKSFYPVLRLLHAESMHSRLDLGEEDNLAGLAHS